MEVKVAGFVDKFVDDLRQIESFLNFFVHKSNLLKTVKLNQIESIFSDKSHSNRSALIFSQKLAKFKTFCFMLMANEFLSKVEQFFFHRKLKLELI